MRQGRVQLELTRPAAQPQSRAIAERHCGAFTRACTVATHIATVCVALIALAIAAPAHAEREGTVAAADLVSPALLTGPGWRVEPTARLRGYQTRFVIHTDWGTLHADSVELLGIRIAEMPAVDALHRTEVTEVLAAATLDAVSEPAKALWNVITNPVDSVVGLPRGTMRYFSERWHKYADRAVKLGSKAGSELRHDGSAYDDARGPMSAATTDGPPKPPRRWFDKPAKEITHAIKGEVRYNTVRRRIAQRLGIDPSTSNPLIAPRLDKLAWAASVGNLATDRALGVLTAGAGAALDYSGKVNGMVLTLTPDDLRRRNDSALAAFCADETLRYAFLVRGRFSATLETELADLLTRLAPATGCEALLETALMARNEIEARFVVNALRLIEHQFGDAARGGRFVPQGAILAYETPGGEFVLPLPLDRLTWTTQMRRWFDARGIAGNARRTVLLSGGISDTAERELTLRGWSIVTRMPYPGAPPYAASILAP